MVGTFHVVVNAVVIIGLSVAVSLLVLWLVRWLVPHDRLTPHNEVSGFVYAVLGVIYAVICGFVVITVWEDYRDAETAARLEADAVGDVYRISEGLPQPPRQELQEPLIAYATSVLDQEWPAMREGTAPSQQAIDALDAVWSAMYRVEVSTPAEEQLYAEALDRLTSLSDYRRNRIEDADSSLLAIMWAVLISGGMLTVLFPCLFGVENGLVHSLIIGTLAASIGLLLFVVYGLNQPFQGDVAVEPEGFVYVLEQISAWRQ